MASFVDDTSNLSSPLSSVPSSPLSSPPNSPKLPPGWRDLTPPLSQDAGEDLPRPRKRRKTEPKIRTTQYLDLTSDTAQSEYDRRESLDLLLKALKKRRKIVVIAGAGISVSAGIPDFRSSHGLFKSLRGEHKLKTSGKALFDASVYKDDSSTSNFHDMVRKLSTMADHAKPTLFHRLLARLSSEGRLLRLYTQNVDGLETALPPLQTQIPLSHKAPWPQTIQLHGGLEKMMCQKCRHISTFQPELFDGPIPPLCPECVAADALRTEYAGKRSHGIGRLRPRIVLYNEHNPDEEAIGAVTTADFRTRPDAVIVVGTSMKIPTVRRIVHEMCNIVRDRREGTTIWINRDPVPPGKDLEDCWDLIVKGNCDEVAQLANLKEWDDDSLDATEDSIESDVEKLKGVDEDASMPSVVVATNQLISVTMTPPHSHNGDNKQVLTPKKISPFKLKIKDETTKKSALKNPASEGRSITEVLTGKENKGRIAKKRGPYKKKTDNINGIQTKIKGKVAKSAIPVSSIKKSVPLSPLVNSNIDTQVKVEYSSVEATPTPETPSSSGYQNRETISPNGNIPADMVKLLN